MLTEKGEVRSFYDLKKRRNVFDIINWNGFHKMLPSWKHLFCRNNRLINYLIHSKLILQVKTKMIFTIVHKLFLETNHLNKNLEWSYPFATIKLLKSSLRSCKVCVSINIYIIAKPINYHRFFIHLPCFEIL